MRRNKTENERLVARTAGKPEHGARHLLLLLMLFMLLLTAAPHVQAVIGTDSEAQAPVQESKQDDVATSQESAKTGTETSKAMESAAKWTPPPMPEPGPYAIVNIDAEKAKELADKWGVELQGMRLTSAGFMMDFRFRVLDTRKALPLFDHRIKPHIVAERSNIKLPVPMATKVGAFRPTNRGKNIKADKTYYMLFGNPDRHVKAGEKVTVVIGDFKVEHLLVN